MNIYLDTNAFYFFFFEHKDYTKGIKKAFEKIQCGEYNGVTSCLTLDELAYVILMRLIEKKYNKHPSDVLRESRHVILEFTPVLHKIFEVIQSFDNLKIVDANKDTAGFIPTIMEETLLLPRDCIHLQTMLNQNCRIILSTDKDFDGIREITRMKPEEVK